MSAVHVGEITISPVLDGMIVSRLPASKALPDEGSEAWRAQHMFRPDGMIESTLGAFLVRSGDQVVLVDAGGGQAVPGGYAPPTADEVIPAMADHFAGTQMERGHLPESLAAAGVAPEDVTDVVLSHLHFDHIGWVTDGAAAFFPNATVRCAAADLDHFLADPPEEATV